ncbi:MAG: tRNA 2-thiouridine(34) synthase MnmA [Candidatus Harrisonbacteria bacterium]|nr:tRNA 2-thiouridine(34) synthase MnmA [Candidatus Harrisonbacteria bacterium]
MKTVFIGMSGGVDSSVTAALLKKRGFDVVGIHLKCFNVDGCAAGDAEDARRAAEHLGIPFYAFDFEKEYKDKVVQYMIDGYKKGITPNPDVMCNQEIKFGLFYKKAMELGADFVATGHYVRRIGKKLFTAKDSNKDQSYFLWTLKPNQIQHCLFPIGDYKKSQVRKLAVKFSLHNAAKKDSQGICFLGKVTLLDFLKKYIPEKPGPILHLSADRQTSVIGEHRGAFYYTIGQRHGLGIGGYEKPLYVAGKDIKKNTVIVAEGEKNPALYKKEVGLTNINLTGKSPKLVYARVRYRQPLEKAGFDGKKLIFSRPIKFVAEGQSAVIYDKKGLMLGGGVIKSAK